MTEIEPLEKSELDKIRSTALKHLAGPERNMFNAVFLEVTRIRAELERVKAEFAEAKIAAQKLAKWMMTDCPSVRIDSEIMDARNKGLSYLEAGEAAKKGE